MLRNVLISAAALLLIAGCGPYGNNQYARMGAPMMLRDARSSEGQVFSYSHTLALLMPHDAVKPRFERARDACLHDAALGCKLVSATISANLYGSGDEANLSVALPHDKVAVFEKSLLVPLAEDGSAKATVQSRSTTAENVAAQASDNERKVAQLTAYRDRLAALAGRSDLSVADLMKVEAELSKVESDLSAALAEKRDVGERVAKEYLTVSLGETAPASAPIARVWAEAGTTLVSNTASALNFLIGIVPWLPLIAAGIVLASWLWRLVRRKKPQT